MNTMNTIQARIHKLDVKQSKEAGKAIEYEAKARKMQNKATTHHQNHAVDMYQLHELRKERDSYT